MKRTLAVRGMPVLCLCSAVALSACSGGSSGNGSPGPVETDTGTPSDTGGIIDTGFDAPSAVDARDAMMDAPDTMMDVQDAMPDASDGVADGAVAAAILALTLDPTLDIDGDTVKATSLTSVEMLDTKGVRLVTATIVAGSASLSLTGIVAGDYFLKVNGDADDLVPTRIDSPVKSFVQSVGTKLRASLVGPSSAPVYRINTYSAGQSLSPAVKFSDATPISGEQPYVLVHLQSPGMEILVLGTAAPLCTYSPVSPMHYDTITGGSVSFDAWLINTNGLSHHGDAFNATGGPATCSGCHSNMGTKPTALTAVGPKSSWCYHCHNGVAGSAGGFLDFAK